MSKQPTHLHTAEVQGQAPTKEMAEQALKDASANHKILRHKIKQCDRNIQHRLQFSNMANELLERMDELVSKDEPLKGSDLQPLNNSLQATMATLGKVLQDDVDQHQEMIEQLNSMLEQNREETKRIEAYLDHLKNPSPIIAPPKGVTYN